MIGARHALRMDARDGLLLDGVPLGAIAAAVGTPAWVYGADTLRARYRALDAAMEPAGARIHYAVKANDHLAILALLAAEGAGADVVSGGELLRALRAGFTPGRIVFSGVGKTRAELDQALAEGVGQINVESPAELEMVAHAAAAAGRIAPIALRINPDVDADTHAKIATGRAGDKFGIPIGQAHALYRHATAARWLCPVGLAVHIGSQIGTLAPYRAACRAVAALVLALRADGMEVRRLDCGGGLAIAYREEPAAAPDAFAALLAQQIGPLGVELIIEPGRWLAGPAGVLLARVILVKHLADPAAASPGRRCIVLDAAMNDLARPSLYEAWHGIVPLSPRLLHAPLAPADVVGPVCESGDILARARALPPLAAEDLVAILDTGAYGAVMSSTYNARPRAPQVLVANGGWHLIRPRQPVADLWRDEHVPSSRAAGAPA